ncbi:MAG: hypothetical protein JNJ55_06460, partial [Betaproteobacteria bacterium]|nr:hypothetical protein [Betaproteobacteria bacterium]
ENIVSAIVEVDKILGDIARAAREQASGIEQVNNAVLQLEDVTQHNAAMVEQAGATAKSMTDQALSLRQLIGRFKLDAGEAMPVAASIHTVRVAPGGRKPKLRPAPPLPAVAHRQ